MLVFRYAFFCIVAMATNLGLQFVAHRWLRLEFWPALCTGTCGGLALKYFLDRNYIFSARGASLVEDTRRFGLYGLLGLVTTALFWVSEWLGHHLFPNESGRYIGGAVGLTLGYVLKYRMDRRWVFADRE